MYAKYIYMYVHKYNITEILYNVTFLILYMLKYNKLYIVDIVQRE